MFSPVVLIKQILGLEYFDDFLDFANDLVQCEFLRVSRPLVELVLVVLRIFVLEFARFHLCLPLV
jgi:hypothetical protein